MSGPATQPPLPPDIRDFFILDLEEKELDVVNGEDGPAVVHVLLEILLEVLEDEGQAGGRVDDVVQGH